MLCSVYISCPATGESLCLPHVTGEANTAVFLVRVHKGRQCYLSLRRQPEFADPELSVRPPAEPCLSGTRALTPHPQGWPSEVLKWAGHSA